MSKLFNLNPRKPNTLNEEAARKLEEAIAAKGEGVAGQAEALMTPQVHELTTSTTAPVEAVPGLVPVEAATAAVEVPAVTPAPARNAVSSRARSTTKLRARELPTTGVGTMHNPRVRKTDGVQTRSTTVHLPVELAKKLAVHCAVTGRKQSDVIAEAVEAILVS